MPATGGQDQGGLGEAGTCVAPQALPFANWVTPASLTYGLELHLNYTVTVRMERTS